MQSLRSHRVDDKEDSVILCFQKRKRKKERIKMTWRDIFSLVLRQSLLSFDGPQDILLWWQAALPFVRTSLGTITGSQVENGFWLRGNASLSPLCIAVRCSPLRKSRFYRPQLTWDITLQNLYLGPSGYPSFHTASRMEWMCFFLLIFRHVEDFKPQSMWEEVKAAPPVKSNVLS